jgi:hypothetical protein
MEMLGSEEHVDLFFIGLKVIEVIYFLDIRN